MTQKDTNFFNIDDMSQGIARTLTDGITTRIFPGEKAMISVVRIEPNATGAVHSHPQEQWGLMIEGSAIRIQDGEEIPVKKGDFWVSPRRCPNPGIACCRVKQGGVKPAVDNAASVKMKITHIDFHTGKIFRPRDQVQVKMCAQANKVSNINRFIR